VAEGSGGKIRPAGGDRQRPENYALAKQQRDRPEQFRAVLFFGLEIRAAKTIFLLGRPKGSENMTAGADIGPAPNQIALWRI
jgi:hypothetical protein